MTSSLLAGCAALSDATPASGQQSAQSAQQTDYLASLPNLTQGESARDAISRTEGELQERLALLAKLADNCEDCRIQLTLASSDAELRLEETGGIWYPWGEQSQSADANQTWREPVPSVGEPPFTVSGTVAYMLSTAEDQLTGLALRSDMDANERIALAGILTGRISSAYQVATAFDLDLDSISAALGEEAFLSIADLPSAQPDPAQSAQSSDADTDAASAAIIDLDCIAAGAWKNVQDTIEQNPTEPGQDLDDEARDAIKDATSATKDISASSERRIAILRNAGIADTRGARCVASPLTAVAGQQELQRISLSLFTSTNEQARLAAVDFAVEDTLTLNELDRGSASTVTPLDQLPPQDQN